MDRLALTNDECDGAKEERFLRFVENGAHIWLLGRATNAVTGRLARSTTTTSRLANRNSPDFGGYKLFNAHLELAIGTRVAVAFNRNVQLNLYRFGMRLSVSPSRDP